MVRFAGKKDDGEGGEERGLGNRARLGEWRLFLCRTPHVGRGSSLHFSGMQIWGGRESSFEGLIECVPGPRQCGARMSLERGGARVPVQVEPLPHQATLVSILGIRTRPGARVAAANCRVAPPLEKVPARWGLGNYT